MLNFDSFFAVRYTFFWLAIIASPELMAASNFVLLFISNLAHSSIVLVKYMLPISSESLYVLSISRPTYFSMYDSIAAA